MHGRSRAIGKARTTSSQSPWTEPTRRSKHEALRATLLAHRLDDVDQREGRGDARLLSRGRSRGWRMGGVLPRGWATEAPDPGSAYRAVGHGSRERPRVAVRRVLP